MGEAKRRRASDPTYGTKQKESWLRGAQKSFKKISNLELMLWIIIIVSSVTTAVWSFMSAQ